MRRFPAPALVLGTFLLQPLGVFAQTAPASTAPSAAAPTAMAPATPTPARLTSIADPAAAPPILVPAFDNFVTYTVAFQGTTEPNKDEIKAGQLVNLDHPTLLLVPTIAVETPVKAATGWLIPIKLSGFVPFGSSTVPIFYGDRKIDTLHLLKNGLTVDPPPAAQQQDDPLLLVLHNRTSTSYNSVRARLRFRDRDVCTFRVQRFPAQQTTQPSPKSSVPAPTRWPFTKWITHWRKAPAAPDACNEVGAWTEFQIPRFSGISLRTEDLPSEWFQAPDGYSHAVPQKGTLTVLFSDVSAPGAALQEQVIPIEVDFQPGTIGRSLGYLRVALWLLTGALFSLVLRVAIPNYRRLRSIRDQLEEIRKTTRGISDEVDSMLRVQLRVESLSLATLAGSTLVVSPSFSGVSQRVETALAALRRRIEYVRRLDAALNRRRLLTADEIAQPSRIAAIDRHLHAASEELKSDQFRDQDWVFIQQALESADKILGTPSEDDKSTFETVLIQRWKSISKQYGFTPEGWTSIPASLAAMKICFPSVDALCPRGPTNDSQAPANADTSQWILSVGTVRADLQITALELIREFEFLAPAQMTDRWANAMRDLIPWLATPAFENLNNARRLLRQLSEGISPGDIVLALQRGEAHIEFDPQTFGSGERVHLAVRFWQPNWNSAAARQEIVCEWRFQSSGSKRQSGTPEVMTELHGSADTTQKTSNIAPPGGQFDPTGKLVYCEKGWEVYHYFEQGSGRYSLDVIFYFEGKPIPDPANLTQPLIYSSTFDLQNEKRSTLYLEQTRRVAFESLELIAALLVPLCALAVSTADKGSSSQWWQLVGLGFGSDTIRNVLSSSPTTKDTKPS